ncbi:MAG: hypothetical protein U1E56_03345 [Bauldia sp.]
MSLLPYFPRGSILSFQLRRALGIGLSTLKHNLYVASFRRMFDECAVDAADSLVLHSPHDFHASALIAVIAERPAVHRPVAHIRVLDAGPFVEAMHPDLLAHLAAIAEDRVFFYAETASTAAALAARLFDRRVDLLRLQITPRRAAPLRADRMAVTQIATILLNLGDVREEKGCRRLASIAQALPKTVGRVSLRLVAHIGAVARGDRKLADRVVADLAATGVEIVSGRLSDGEMTGLLEGVDVAVMPYTSDRYRLRGSGIGPELVMHGVPLVVSAGSVLTEHVAGQNGLSAAGDGEFATAVCRILADYPAYAAAARSAAHSLLAECESSPLFERLKSAEAA